MRSELGIDRRAPNLSSRQDPSTWSWRVDHHGYQIRDPLWVVLNVSVP